MKTLTQLIFAALLAVLASTPAMSANCTAEDYEEAGQWDFGDPDEAYAFGKKIQGFIRQRDLEGLFSLVDGELWDGPRRKFVENKSFGEIFSEDWVDWALADEPSCTPHGWRGYVTGGGTIWYAQTDAGWTIYRIFGGVEEAPAVKSTGWRFDGRLIHPLCFPGRPVILAFEFEPESLRKYGIEDADHFYSNPGEYLGTVIPNIESWEADFCGDPHECDAVPFVELGKCSPGEFEYMRSGQGVHIVSEGFPEEHGYTVLRKVEPGDCSRLGPDIGTDCIESFLVEVYYDGGGTIGPEKNYGIYGVFDIPDFGPSMVALRFLGSKNDALNHFEENYQ